MWNVIGKLGSFFVNFFTAIKFGVYDYDFKLRATKTNNQRIVIWIVIFITTITLCTLFLWLAGRFIKTTIDNRFLLFK